MSNQSHNLNCKEITQIITKINHRQLELISFIDKKELEKAKKVKDELIDLINSPDLRPEIEKNEMIKKNQKLYDWLGVEADISKLYRAGEIQDLSPEMKEAAKKQGYTEPIIILNSINLQNLEKGIGERGFYFREDYSPTTVGANLAQITEALRPEKNYIVYLKPQQLAKDAHPDIGVRKVSEVIRLAENLIKNTPGLAGYTRREYLLHQIYYYLEHNDFIDDFDQNGGGALLLDEDYDARSGTPAKVIGYHAKVYQDTPLWLTWIYKHQGAFQEEESVRLLMLPPPKNPS